MIGTYLIGTRAVHFLCIDNDRKLISIFLANRQRQTSTIEHSVPTKRTIESAQTEGESPQYCVMTFKCDLYGLIETFKSQQNGTWLWATTFKLPHCILSVIFSCFSFRISLVPTYNIRDLLRNVYSSLYRNV